MKPTSQPVLHIDDMNYASKAEKCSTNFTIHELNVKLKLFEFHVYFFFIKLDIC